MPNQQETTTKLREFVYTQFPLARQREIGDDASLIEQGIVDSMGVLEIVTFIESEFGFELADDEMLGENFESIATLGEFVNARLEQNITAEA